MNYKIKKNELIIIGAGNYGKEALQRYGEDIIYAFCDNDRKKVGSIIDGKTVVSFEEMVRLHESGYSIMICIEEYASAISQLEKSGIYDYLIYRRPGLPYVPFDSPENEENIRNNKWLKDIEIESENLDLLADVTPFRSISDSVHRECIINNKFARYMYAYQQEYYYGNTEALMRYGNIGEEYKKFFPVVSHFDIIPWYNMQFYYVTATIVSGEYFMKAIHQRRAYLPVFCVGPYIHYAENYYDDDTIKTKLKSIGKMMLIFLPHTVEDNPAKYDGQRFIDKIISNYAKSYDSFWMCVYWTDLNSEICDYATNKGIKIVSAGIRTDRNFLSRLKTMLGLCDSVVCGDTGTFLSYASHMGKPIALVDINEKDYSRFAKTKFDSERNALFDYTDFNDFMRDFYSLFDETPRLDQKQKDWIKEYSGEDKIRNKRYIKAISDISYDLWRESCWNIDEYPHAVHRVYRGYEISRQFYKMSVLQEAVSDLMI